MEPVRNLVERNFVLRNIRSGIGLLTNEPSTMAAGLFLLALVVTGIAAPAIAPYEANELIFRDDGTLKSLVEPNSQHLLGTTDGGQDIFSRLILGSRATLLVGFGGGMIAILIGMFMGVTSGYLGGKTDELLMRFADFFYGIPVIPSAILLVAFFGLNFLSLVFIIGAVLWRASARVIRSQVIQIRQRSYIKVLRASGASDRRIVFKHIIPNITGMLVLFFALSSGFAIILQANLVFIGVGDPFLPTWGTIIRNAFDAGQMSTAVWWSLPPGLLIILTVVSTFIIGRSYEYTGEKGI